MIKAHDLATVTMGIVTNIPNFFDVSAAQTEGMMFKEEIIHII